MADVIDKIGLGNPALLVFFAARAGVLICTNADC